MGKNNSTTWGNKPESTGQRRKTKEISTKGKTIQTKQDIPKQRKKILSTIGRDLLENIPTNRYKRNRTILDKKIWQPKEHNENAEWINNIIRELDGLDEGPEMETHVDLLRTTLKRISHWKAPGHVGIHGFWFKKFTSIHDRLALEMSRCLQGAQIPEWMTKGKTTLIQKDPSKGTAPNNYRPITCLSMMWKILTAQIREKIYYSLTSRGFFPDEQKGCRKGSRGTAELLFIDRHILNESKTRRKNLAMAWIDYKKAIDMVT